MQLANIESILNIKFFAKKLQKNRIDDIEEEVNSFIKKNSTQEEKVQELEKKIQALVEVVELLVPQVGRIEEDMKSILSNKQK